MPKILGDSSRTQKKMRLHLPDDAFQTAGRADVLGNACQVKTEPPFNFLLLLR